MLHHAWMRMRRCAVETAHPLIVLASPTVLLIGGVGAFVQTYRVWKRRESWWVWQGAGWFLLLLMVVNLMLAGRMMMT